MGLEGNLAGTATVGAYSVVHLAGSAVSAAGSLAGVTAGFATLRLIGEAFFSEKFLILSSESELLSALFAD